MPSPFVAEPFRWEPIEPEYAALLREPVRALDVPDWLARWSALDMRIWEARAHLKRMRSRDETDLQGQRAWATFAREVFAPFERATQALKVKLLDLRDYSPAPRYHELMRRLRFESSFFRAENVAVNAELADLTGAYGPLAQRVRAQLSAQADRPTLLSPHAGEREATWRDEQDAWRTQRADLDDLFFRILAARRRLARTAGMENVRAYRWGQLGRLDLTPADCLAFAGAVETSVVPLAARRWEARLRTLGSAVPRPWDVEWALASGQPDAPFTGMEDFEDGMARLFAAADAELGDLFGRMRDGFLDLAARPGKMGGSEEWLFPVTGLPYVRVTAATPAEYVTLLAHEMGHAFHDTLSLRAQQVIWNVGGPSEFEELPSIAMTHLVSPLLASERVGIYPPPRARQAQTAALDEIIMKWLPFIAKVEVFQHWLFADAPADVTAVDIGQTWRALSQRFEPWVNWSGLEPYLDSGWHQVGATFQMPFYNVAYGLAHVGALHLWRLALEDWPAAWRAYRGALTLGATRPAPDLYRTVCGRLPYSPQEVSATMAMLTTYLAHAPR